MDRDTTLRMIAAIALSFAVLIAWQRMFGPEIPPPGEAIEEAAAEGEIEPGPAGAFAGPAGGEEDAGQVPDAGVVAEVAAERVEGEPGAEPVAVLTPRTELLFSTRGARLLGVRLLEHEKIPGDPTSGVVDLVSPESRNLDLLPLTLVLPDPEQTRQVNEAWFVMRDDVASADGERRVSFRYADGRGLEAEKTITIAEDGRYLLRVDWEARQDGRPIEGARIAWGPGLGRPIDQDTSNRFAYRGYAVVAEAGEVERYAPEKLSGDLLWDRGPRPAWLALDNQYFAVAVVPNEPAPASVRAVAVQRDGEAVIELLIETGAPSLTLFAGPKSDRLLREIDADLGTSLAELVDWGIFEILARPLYVALSYFEGLTGNWGVAIVLLTLVIKVLFFPLTQRAMVNMRRTQEKMGALQPKIRKVKEKYRDKKEMESRRKMQEEMMAVYKDAGVNPMAPVAGCLPLLLQLPVLYGMYSLLTVVIDMRGAPFYLWIRDLSAADPYWYGLPMVMGATMLGQQVLSLTKVEDPQQKAQQRMMLIMPVMFTYFFIWLPSGLVLYWLTNNVLGIAQQWLINRQAAAKNAEAEAASGKKGRTGKSGKAAKAGKAGEAGSAG